MKSLFIIYAPALEEEIMNAVAKTGQKKYTKIPYMHGVGGHSEPHLDDHVWPGSNTGLFIVTDQAIAQKICALLSDIKKKNLDEGLKIFMSDVEEVI